VSSADAIATLQPAIAEVLEASKCGDVWCATFEVSGDTSRWVQITADTLNLPYPLVEPPQQVLASLGLADAARLELREWKAREFATFEVPEGATAAEMARIADGLLRGLLGCAAAYALDVKMEKLDDAE
jgi:hypothetical protein